jgi:hypothetical protein
MSFGRVEITGLKEALRLVSKETVNKALRSALSRSTNSVRAEAIRVIREGYNIKRADIAPYVNITARPSYSDLSATITVSSKKIQMINFNPRQTKTGLTASMKRGMVSTIPHGFIQNMHGHQGAWLRAKYVPKAKTSNPNTPILLRGPSITELIGSKAVMKRLTDKFFERMDVEFPRALNAFVKGYASMGGGE